MKFLIIKKTPQKVVIDFKNSRIWDHSALEALKKLAARYGACGKEIRYRSLSWDCAALLERSGCQIEKNKDQDPVYEVVMDRSHEAGEERVK
jgi:SulP family sulfate permease